MIGIRIAGTGSYLPQKVLSNKDLEKIVDTTDEWIETRTGIKQRHIAAKDQATSDLCTQAGNKAIVAAGLTPKDIDMVIVGTSTPDMLFPATACFVQKNLGCRPTIPSFDFEIACSSYIYGFIMAAQFIKTQIAKNILFITGDVMSRVLNYKDRGTCILFGDGASAVVLSASEQDHLLGFDWGADGYAPHELLSIPGGGSRNPLPEEGVDPNLKYLTMQGGEIYRLAVKHMAESLQLACQKASVEPSSLDFVIPHQANVRIMNSVAKQLSLPKQKLINTLAGHANISGATVGMALDIAINQGTIKRGDLLGLTAFGAGLSWGSLVVRY